MTQPAPPAAGPATAAPALPSTADAARVRSRRPRPFLWTGAGILAVLVVVGVVGPFLVADPLAVEPSDALQAPSAAHWFGTDFYGRDVFARAVHAIRLDLVLGVSIALLAMVVGSALGVVSGYVGGRVDDVVMRCVDVLMSFPGFVLAMILLLAIGESTPQLALALAVAAVPPFVRLVRAEALAQRELAYVDGARVAGAGWLRIAFGHVLPHSVRPAAVQFTLVCGYSILNVAGLAYLGIGIHAPTPEWGVMVAEGAQNMLTGQWWTAFFPGLLIAVTVTGLHFVGDDLGGDR
ncbi:ABC transporter permease [Cellulomonas sp. P4]|uniref:ABC transporter permease n=1 Tax=Cellulomonas sp. P4 TaxID=3142533 RepID=UPI0031B9D9CB